MQRLLHRWFVQYNPLYLVSAALVLVGVNLLSHDLVGKGFLLRQLGVPAIAEVYAWALIGGAAFLMRIGLRRPAVMLALLAAFYQCDVTLHVETCAYLGAVGLVAAAIWWVSFVAKLYALGWAMQIRPSRAVFAIPSFAALGLVVVPRCLRMLDVQSASTLVAAFVFAVFAAALWTFRRVDSKTQLDRWGKTVMRRSLVATWALWATLFMLHVVFLCSEYSLSFEMFIPVALLLATRFMPREAPVWAVVTGTLVVVVGWMPALTSLIAMLGAVTLGLRTLRQPSGDSLAKLRLLSGALFAVYLSVWTLGWSGGGWPDHMLALDLTLTVAVGLSAWKLGTRWPVGVVAALHVHHGVALELIGLPTTTFGWGALLVSVGFVILIASLMLSYGLRRRPRSCV